MGSLGVRFEVGGGIKLLRLKLVRIMLSTSNLARKYTDISSFKKYTFQYQGPLNFADFSIFSKKNLWFLAKILRLLKAIVWQLC